MNKTVRRMGNAIARGVERFGQWCLDRLPGYLGVAVIVMGVMCLGVQLGIRKGRALERVETGAEVELLGKRLAWAEAEQDRLEGKHDLILRMIECESGGRHEGVWGDAGQSYGLLQVQKKTFYELAGKAGFEGANWKNAVHQLRVLSWALDNGYGRKWTCYQEASA